MYRVLVFSSIVLFTLSASPLAFTQTASTIEIEKRLHKADSLRRRIKFSDAWNQLAVISGLQEEMTTEQLAQYFKLRGATQVGFRKYSEALESYAKSKAELEKLTTPKSEIDLVNLYTLRGTVFNKNGEYEKATAIFLEGIEKAQGLPEKDRILAEKYLYTNLGENYDLLGQYDNAVITNNIALNIAKELGQEISVGAGVAHNNLGICYRQLGRYNLAQEHYNKAADIFTEALSPTSRYTYAARSNAAAAIDDFGDIEKAIPLLMQTLDAYAEHADPNQDYVVNTFSTLGYIYKRIGDYDKSVDAYERALGKLRSMDTYKQDLEIRILKSLAGVELYTGAMAKARLYLDEAFEIESTHNVLSPTDLVRLYHTNATYYQFNGQHEDYYKAVTRADSIASKDEKNQLSLILTTRPRYIDALISQEKLELAQQAIDSTTIFIEVNKSRISNTDLIKSKANMDGLKAILACAKGEAEQAIESGIDRALEAHTRTLIAATASTSGKKNQRYACSTCFNVGDLLDALANLHFQAFQNDATKKKKHLEQALAVLDIKQSYLTDIWKNEHFSGLNRNQRDVAKEIRQRIAAYDLLIFENDSGSPTAQKQNALYLDSILALRPKLTAFISQLTSKPLDFNRTFDYSQLAEDQGVLIFHQEADLIHAILVYRKGMRYHTISDANNLGDNLKKYQSFCSSEESGFSESRETLNLAANLYDTLLGWLPEEMLNSSSRIAIIEGYPVESIPFAALLVEPVSAEDLGFRDLTFAVEKHAFSYHQSPSVFFESQSKSRYANAIKLSALAPSQLSSESIASASDGASPTLQLDYATQEVESLLEKYKGTLLKGKQANFDGLKNAFTTSNVVHIASHATSNYANGDYSYIIITDTTSLSGERLYARTLSELELPADLVVLGACESGYGKVSKGEGAMSLANIFLNVGTQSVVHTSWRVEDKLSQDVLLGFYDELAQQQPLDQALTKAQRSYLKSAGGQYLHPFYWSAFAVSGNLTPMVSNSNDLLFFGLPFALLAILFVFWKRR